MFLLLMKPAGDFEGVGELDKLFFILALVIDTMRDSGGVIFLKEEFNSTNGQPKLFLASQT